MTDAFEAQGEFAPVQSATHNEFTAATDTMSEAPILEALDAASPEAAAAEEPAKPNGFIKLGLAPELIAAVADLGFTQPTTVQEKVVPIAMGEEGAARFVDLMVSSQTGSGKTAAFLLPVLHTLLKRQAEAEAEAKAEFQRLAAEAAARGEAPPKKPKRKDPTNARHFKAATPGALILCPTRELAQQVAHDAIELVRHCRGLRIANVVGGMPYQLQIAKLQNADLVVATPGRLLDLQRSQQLKLDQVKFLVVDEADRMLDLGFSDDLAEVNQLTIERQQTMMFSATFAPRIQQLAQRVMREPQRITIDSPQEKHANIKQVLFWADNSQHKRKLLDHWLRDTSINQAIVFASTQVECDGLANDLQQEGFSAVALHGALSQGLRNRRLMALRQGQVQILVATDVAARGIDVPTITHVFNFGLPMKAEDYTHRIGRTGRAGRDGLAVTFAEFRDRRKIMDIEHYSRQQFKAEVVPGMEPQQRMPQSRPPQGEFRGGRGDSQSRDRKFGGGGGYRGGNGGGNGGYAGASGFNDRNSRGPAAPGPRGFQGGQNAGFGGGRDEGGNGGGAGYGRKPGWGDSAPRGGHGHGGGRGDGGFAPREGFAPRGNGAAGHGGPGKVFVPRDAQKRAFKPSR
ncbi:Superfamily II DNA and RNA helicase [Variovorax sp. YR266]|uniref:DEAD/DEAH box helicase n=1 Tax=Variovorax sp. YR266 TaxID=1884386 RepID=UPI0008960947|nr:DEAD/DEAH box helicase [Variovorax sp. YR266]SDY07746.1 Superfamily II DNA and RNA helicase [Variovorax sp. YR266]